MSLFISRGRQARVCLLLRRGTCAVLHRNKADLTKPVIGRGINKGEREREGKEEDWQLHNREGTGSTTQRFADRVQIEVRGGKGGNGCISYDVTSPGCKKPSGGNGGKGGSVFISGDSSLFSLKFQTYHFNAADGKHGGSAGLTGRGGDDVHIKVPLGTIVTDRSSPDDDLADWDEDDDEDELGLTDGLAAAVGAKQPVQIDDEHTMVLVARGGLNGQGNQATMRSSKGGSRQKIRSMPATYIPGQTGEARSLILELKIIADVGLVGFPNAGKSSLVRVLSNAEPRVASYAFTTLHPSIGVVEYSDCGRITVADIPGLIEGAHEDRGLGHDFLRHIERTKLLLYVVDCSSSAALEGVGRGPSQDLRCLFNELTLYDPALLAKPSLVFANKIDIDVDSKALQRLIVLARQHGMSVMTGSALTGAGIPQLARQLREALYSSRSRSAHEQLHGDDDDGSGDEAAALRDAVEISKEAPRDPFRRKSRTRSRAISSKRRSAV